MGGLCNSDISKYLFLEPYFSLSKLPFPTSTNAVIDKFIEEGFVLKNRSYAITKLGAILFARNLRDFDSLYRKTPRVIVYKGKGKIETDREYLENKGYAVAFDELDNWINGQLPAKEVIEGALRKDIRMYPPLAIRELVSNALIHQDFHEIGFPMIEIFNDRVEISNPGLPLVPTDRFIDAYKARNQKLADTMRRLGFCEEKGSGMDKVIRLNEKFQLPPIKIETALDTTKVTIFSYKRLKDLDRKEKIIACYQHACLRYVNGEFMTNQSLRERFEVGAEDNATISKIIRESLNTGDIKEKDPENKSKRFTRYIPTWA